MHTYTCTHACVCVCCLRRGQHSHLPYPNPRMRSDASTPAPGSPGCPAPPAAAAPDDDGPAALARFSSSSASRPSNACCTLGAFGFKPSACAPHGTQHTARKRKTRCKEAAVRGHEGGNSATADSSAAQRLYACMHVVTGSTSIISSSSFAFTAAISSWTVDPSPPFFSRVYQYTSLPFCQRPVSAFTEWPR